MIRFLRVAAAVAILAPAFSQNAALYKDPSVPMQSRVDNLVSLMTLEEKISQLTNDSPAIDRLGIPAYNWWNECLHGVARAGRATVFPQTIGLAATWDPALIHHVAEVISDEARAKHHEFVRRGKRNIYQGLTFWTPNINLFRDPRWGRGMETYGEDPYLTGTIATQFIKGLQGDDPKYLKTVATAKHYAVHSGPESLRHTFDAVVDEEDLRETYLPQFEMAIKDGGAWSVMCAYNSVDGQPACANPRLLDTILRKEWGFKGYVVSDCGAIGDIYLNHKFISGAPAGVAKAVQAGTDLNCGVEYGNLLPAVRQGLIAESEIDLAVKRLLLARFKLGMFDPPSMVKYARIPYSVNDSAQHRTLALETARKSIVLLKNENHTLPLRKSLKTIAVIGPNADDLDVLVGNYNGQPSSFTTPLAGIRRKLGSGARVIYERGSDVAAGLPNFEVVPTAALFTGNGPDRKNGLTGNYYNSSNFDGKQHRPLELTYPGSGKNTGVVPRDPKPVFARIDPKVDFRWWDGAPRKDLNDDNFGVRWSGYIAAPATGTYQLGAIGLNAFELYLDGKRIVDSNNIHESSYHYVAVPLEAGKLHEIRLDYHEFVNDADIQLVWSRPDITHEQDAIAAAKKADAVVMVLGLSPRLEGEEMKVPVEGFDGGDRVALDLPRVQQALMEKIVATGKPVVVVLLNGSAVAVNWARDHVPAIVEAWYPGEEGGSALADVLFGDYNPAGRLPVTFYKSAAQLPPFTSYAMRGKTYRFFTGEPLYPFGYGLSYSSFSYRALNVPPKIAAGSDIKITVEVENTSNIAGEEVAQLYIKHSDAAESAPLRSLAGFERLRLRPKERKTVQFTLHPKQYAEMTREGHWVMKAGVLEVFAGGMQPGSGSNAVSGRIAIEGASRQLP